jgi:hypothetical protein
MRAKRRSNELSKECPMYMNGLRTKVDLNIIPLVSFVWIGWKRMMLYYNVITNYLLDWMKKGT